MGIWDEYCTVCGGPPYVDNMDDEEGVTPSNPADYSWLESFIGITNTEEVIPLTTYDNYGGFSTLPETSPYVMFRMGCRIDEFSADDVAQGYACHAACYNLLQQELNYTLKCADVLPLLVDNEYDVNKFSWSDYGGLAEYQQQFFNEVDLVKDGKLWMIEDPSRDAQNKERILQLWRPLVESGFKRPDERVGVASSAPEIAEANVDELRA